MRGRGKSLQQPVDHYRARQIKQESSRSYATDDVAIRESILFYPKVDATKCDSQTKLNKIFSEIKIKPLNIANVFDHSSFFPSVEDHNWLVELVTRDNWAFGCINTNPGKNQLISDTLANRLTINRIYRCATGKWADFAAKKFHRSTTLIGSGGTGCYALTSSFMVINGRIILSLKPDKYGVKIINPSISDLESNNIFLRHDENDSHAQDNLDSQLKEKRFSNEYEQALQIANKSGYMRVKRNLPEDNVRHIINEYFQGITLTDYLDKIDKESLNQKNILDIFYNILSDFRAIIFRQNKVYLDLKLDNILINPETRKTKIIDFDSVTLINKNVFCNYTNGTPGYIAPELLLNDQTDVDSCRKAMVYSLGIVLAAMMGLLDLKWYRDNYPCAVDKFKCQKFEQLVRNQILANIKKLSSETKSLGSLVAKMIRKEISGHAGEKRYTLNKMIVKFNKIRLEHFITNELKNTQNPSMRKQEEAKIVLADKLASDFLARGIETTDYELFFNKLGEYLSSIDNSKLAINYFFKRLAIDYFNDCDSVSKVSSKITDFLDGYRLVLERITHLHAYVMDHLPMASALDSSYLTQPIPVANLIAHDLQHSIVKCASRQTFAEAFKCYQSMQSKLQKYQFLLDAMNQQKVAPLIPSQEKSKNPGRTSFPARGTTTTSSCFFFSPESAKGPRLLELKKELLNEIADYVNSKWFFGFSILSKRRKKDIFRLERIIYESATRRELTMRMDEYLDHIIEDRSPFGYSKLAFALGKVLKNHGCQYMGKIPEVKERLPRAPQNRVLSPFSRL